MDDSRIAPLESGRHRNPVYHKDTDRLFRFLIPKAARVLELGCGTGRLLASLDPSVGVGVDSNPECVEAARTLHEGRQGLEFLVGDIETLDWSSFQPFDYIIASDLLPLLNDVQAALTRLHSVCTPRTRLLVKFHSNLWRPLLAVAEAIGRRERTPEYAWLSSGDISNLLALSAFEVVTRGTRTLLPVSVPLLTFLANDVLARAPLVGLLSVTTYSVARPAPRPLPRSGPGSPSVSVVIPTRNEKGNIEDAFRRTPRMGRWTELVFVDGRSTDGTVEEILRCAAAYGSQWKRVELIHQTGTGKGQAMRQAFAECRGDILMILDSDLTMPPEDLPKFYEAVVSGRGEFINGCRLVYPMEKEAMQFANMVANYGFGKIFTWLIGQPIKDTLCGTKVLWRKDYEAIAANRSFFGDFDPFGDFDLLFGASRLNLKIVDLPIRYRGRTYGETKISRWRHGVLLARMCLVALRKLKLS
jgi:SAM-dependent methyltransferase